jgi:hypothetical protein
MNKPVVAGVIAAVAVFAGVLYSERQPAQNRPLDDGPTKAQGIPAPAVQPAAPTRPDYVASSKPPPRTTPADPRLAALMVSPDNALIEYFSDPEGRVIREVDNDPNSPGYRKPLREYSYAGNQVIRLVTYHYRGDQVQVTTTDVTYKADGNVDQFHEATRPD